MKQLNLGLDLPKSKSNDPAERSDCKGCSFDPHSELKPCSYLGKATLGWAKKIYVLDSQPYATEFRLLPRCYRPNNFNIKVMYEEGLEVEVEI